MIESEWEIIPIKITHDKKYVADKPKQTTPIKYSENEQVIIKLFILKKAFGRLSIDKSNLGTGIL